MTSQPSSDEEQTPKKGFKVARILATVFGLGYFPYGPGTLASFVTVLFWSIFLYAGLSAGYLLLAGMAIFLIGLWACEQSRLSFPSDDPSEIVIDEVAGQTIAMSFIVFNFQYVIFSFVLFRILDIIKPGPIGFLDRKVKGGLGIMLDDVVAGFIVMFLAKMFQYLP